MPASSTIASVVALVLLCSVGHAAATAAAATPAPKPMAVPCYMRMYDGFCFTQTDANACTFYSSPSYNTYEECKSANNMGRYLQCYEVKSSELRDSEGYKTCVDREVYGRQPGGGSSSAGPVGAFAAFQNMDVEGYDIPANGKSYTEICNLGLDGVKRACTANSGCSGFTWNGQCGFLKTSVQVSKSRGGWSVYGKATNKLPPTVWVTSFNNDVQGSDIPSNGLSYTKLCKSVDEVRAACVSTSGCQGFTYDGSCGYLKTSVSNTKNRAGWTVYTKQ